MDVDSRIDTKNVQVYGPGIEYCRAQIPSSFKIDASKAGKAPLDVSMTTDRGNRPKIRYLHISYIRTISAYRIMHIHVRIYAGPLETKPEVYDNGDGTYDVVYLVNDENAVVTAKVLYNGEHIPNR